MSRRELDAHQRRMALLALGASVVVLTAALLGAGEALAYLVPAAGPFALLALGLYPGAGAYARALTRAGTKAPRPRASRPRRLSDASLPRGGALLAAGLAGRAPPRFLR